MVKILVTEEELDFSVDLKQNDRKEYCILRNKVQNMSYQFLPLIRKLNTMKEEGYIETFSYKKIRKTSKDMILDQRSDTYRIWNDEFYIKIRDELYNILRDTSYGYTAYRWFVKDTNKKRYNIIMKNLNEWINIQYMKILKESLK